MAGEVLFLEDRERVPEQYLYAKNVAFSKKLDGREGRIFRDA